MALRFVVTHFWVPAQKAKKSIKKKKKGKKNQVMMVGCQST